MASWKKRFVWQIRWHRLSTAACQTLYIVRCRQHRCVSLSARCRCCLNFLDLVPWFTTFFRCQLNRLLSVLIKKDDIANSVTVRTGTHWRESQIRPGTRSTLSTLSRFRRCFVESRLSAALTTLWNKCRTTIFILVMSLWTPAQRKRASMLYFANVFFYLFFLMAALFSGPG